MSVKRSRRPHAARGGPAPAELGAAAAPAKRLGARLDRRRRACQRGRLRTGNRKKTIPAMAALLRKREADPPVGIDPERLAPRAPADADRTGRHPPIGDYALIGDARTAALVSRAGSVDWLCLPSFHDDAVFAALLDWQKGGRFAVTPRQAYSVERSYTPETACLATRFTTAAGTALLSDMLLLPCEDVRCFEPQRERLRRLVCQKRRDGIAHRLSAAARLCASAPAAAQAGQTRLALQLARSSAQSAHRRAAGAGGVGHRRRRRGDLTSRRAASPDLPAQPAATGYGKLPQGAPRPPQGVRAFSYLQKP